VRDHHCSTASPLHCDCGRNYNPPPGPPLLAGCALAVYAFRRLRLVRAVRVGDRSVAMAR
jgi:hypothetical protein